MYMFHNIPIHVSWDAAVLSSTVCSLVKELERRIFRLNGPPSRGLVVIATPSFIGEDRVELHVSFTLLEDAHE